MITAILLSVAAAVFYLFFRKQRKTGRFETRGLTRRAKMFLLICLLTVAALFSKRARDRVNEIKERLKN